MMFQFKNPSSGIKDFNTSYVDVQTAKLIVLAVNLDHCVGRKVNGYEP